MISDTTSAADSGIFEYFQKWHTQPEDETLGRVRAECLQGIQEVLARYFEEKTEGMGSARMKTFKSLPCKCILKQFGSSVFGGAGKDSDIDLLLSGFNELMSREEFTSELVDYLKRSGAQNVVAVPLAKVPIVKMEFQGVQLDLLYCAMLTPNPSWIEALMKSKVPLAQVQAYLADICNATYDKANNLSYLGLKTCTVMLEMIEDKRAFSCALRILKFWAKRRGIYGFNFGYLNGISLVIMLIKAQQHLQKTEPVKRSHDLEIGGSLNSTMHETPAASFID